MRKAILAISVTCFVSLANAGEAFVETSVLIPVTDGRGVVRNLQTRICTSKMTGPANVVILNHGSPPSVKDRPAMTSYWCNSEPAQWFLARGYVVVVPLRRGYGATGGSWDENFGKCDRPDFFRAGLETARDMQAAANFASTLPNVKPENIVIVGQSAGGWGTLALNSVPHPHVKAIINMAGGRGGHSGPKANENCAPDQLAAAAGKFGATATTPMLWIYAENDSFFAPAISKSLADAFVKSGGKAEYILKPPFGVDGHSEFAAKGGSLIWGDDFTRYLANLVH